MPISTPTRNPAAWRTLTFASCCLKQKNDPSCGQNSVQIHKVCIQLRMTLDSYRICQNARKCRSLHFSATMLMCGLWILAWSLTAPLHIMNAVHVHSKGNASKTQERTQVNTLRVIFALAKGVETSIGDIDCRDLDIVDLWKDRKFNGAYQSRTSRELWNETIPKTLPQRYRREKCSALHSFFSLTLRYKCRAHMEHNKFTCLISSPCWVRNSTSDYRKDELVTAKVERTLHAQNDKTKDKTMST